LKDTENQRKDVRPVQLALTSFPEQLSLGLVLMFEIPVLSSLNFKYYNGRNHGQSSLSILREIL
jgi:hypothetical protein